MFDVYFCPRVVQRLQRNLDAAVLAGFLGYLDRVGYRRNTIHLYVRAAELLLRWLRRSKQLLSSIDEQTVRWFTRHCRSARGSQNTMHAALRQLLSHSRAAGVATARAATATRAVERLVGDYDSHLDRVCGLADATRLYRRRYARDFVQFVFGSGRMDWRRVRIEHARDFIAQYGTHNRTAAAQVAAVALPSFLRWLQFQGRVNSRLVASVPHFRQWRCESLPTGMSDVQLNLFLATFDRSHATGRRDFAMALCLSDLGMRVSDVADLQIDHVDAESGVFRLAAGKARRERLLPMPRRVRQAVLAYIRRGRPQTEELQLFVRHGVPVGTAVTSELIRGVMRGAFAVVPGCERLTRTHVLRHTAATRWQWAGADLKRVADILGHRSLDTTAIYTKLDLDRLTEVALPWPNGEEAHS